MTNERRRKSLRLRNYDYNQAGAYFVTVVVKGRTSIFGEVVGEEVKLNEYGEIVEISWLDLPNHYEHISLDSFIIMPNHIHGIVVISDTEANGVGAGLKPAPTQRHALPEVMRAFKTFSARQINQQRRAPGVPLWQRGYFDHIIRNETDLDRIRDYISTNPLRWTLREKQDSA